MIDYKISFDFLYKFCVKLFKFLEELSEMLSQMYLRLHLM